MKSFRPKSEDAPPGGEGPDGPPPDAAVADRPEDDALPETMPTPQPSRHGRNAEVDFRGRRRSNATHASTTDPDARLYRKSAGTGAVLCFMGHALMEKPQRPRRAGRADAGLWPCRTARGPRHDPRPFAGLDAAPDARGGQGL